MSEHTQRFIRTPDQRLRVFVSSTLQELAEERAAARAAIEQLHLTPVLFELGARPHPPRDLYRAYLAQSHIFVGLYWQRYGWVAPGETISGLEDEYCLAGDRPKLIYLKTPAPAQEEQLQALLEQIRKDDRVSYKSFVTPDELRDLLQNDLAVLLTERFELAQPLQQGAGDHLRPQRRHNLPTPRTALINRSEESTQLYQCLLNTAVALVTLTGSAGAGKSRLALQVGLALADHFSDGVYLVALESLREPKLVIPTIAQTLGLHETAGGPSLVDQLYAYLRTKQLLLLLDNFEQVIAAGPTVSDLLEYCAQIKILVTSRMPLRVRGERVLPLAPLTLPQQQATLAELATNPAIALFLARAQAVNPAFQLTTENAEPVAELCRRLDGLPLAIELAAARIKILSPQAMLARLTQPVAHYGARLALLTIGARDLPARQQTLRNTLDWGHQLLDASAQILFRRVAVFAGGWTLEAAERITNADGALGADVLEELEALVDMSLLMRDERPTGEARFSLLETIHEYALEHLIESGEVTTMRRRHADYYLALAEQAEPELKTARRDPWLQQLAEEHDNIRAVLDWSTSPEGDHQIGLRLAGAVALFWRIRGYFSEGRAWLQALLADRAALGRTPELGRALVAAGTLAWIQGDVAAARPLLEESLSIGQDVGDQRIVAHALNSLGLTLLTQGEPDAACAYLQESAARFHALHDDWGETYSLNPLGDALMMVGDFAQARQRYEESLALAQTIGDLWVIAGAHTGLGNLALAQGQAAAAQKQYEESLPFYRQVGDRFGLSWATCGLGFANLYQRDFVRARDLFQVCLTAGQEMGYATITILYLVGMAGLAAHQAPVEQSAGRLQAARLLGAAEQLRRTLQVTLWEPFRLIDQQLLTTTRTATEPAAWEAAFAEGQAMTVEQTVAYTLGTA